MKTVCEHGYYKFYVRTPEQLDYLTNIKKLRLVPENDHYTFPRLKNLRKYTILGMPYDTLPAITTFSGRKEDCLKANKMVYNLKTNQVVFLPPSFIQDRGGIVTGIPQVGMAITASKKMVTGFVGDYLLSVDTMQIVECETL